MFGKFGKKKQESVETEIKSKQKNDLFTLLEQTPENNLKSTQSLPDFISKTTKPDTSPKTTKPDTSSKTTKPDTSSETTQHDTSSKTTKHDTSSETTKHDTSSETTKPDTSSKTTKHDNSSETIKSDPNSMTTAELDVDTKTVNSLKAQTKYVPPASSIKGDKSQLLLLEIEKLPDKTIKPVVDFNENCLFYPILAKIGESPDNVSYFDDLVNDGVLTKQVFEKLIICPLHPNAFSSSVRLYCPKCNSLNVDKLNLYEHKRCGYITESSAYDFSNPENSTCPSCKRKITDFKKEIRVPAMWHQCQDCSEKFDNAIIKLYCRQYEHDFDTNTGLFVTAYSYRLKDYDAPITTDDDKMHEDLEKLLKEFNFSTEFSASVKGKSGNSHKVPIYAKNNSSGETIAIFINRQTEKLAQSDINSILISILDIDPKNILLLTTSEVEKDVLPLAKQYGIKIISSSDLSKIIQLVEQFVSANYSRFGEK